MMRIFVDGDAMPIVVRNILFRAAERTRIPLVLVANQPIHTPRSDHITCITVPAGPDEADDRIVEMAQAGDLVITADIPLADRAIGKRAIVIDPRGALYTSENIKEKLSLRDLMDELRGCGIDTGGPSAFCSSDCQAFANQLDRLLTKYLRNSTGDV